MRWRFSRFSTTRASNLATPAFNSGLLHHSVGAMLRVGNVGGNNVGGANAGIFNVGLANLGDYNIGFGNLARQPEPPTRAATTSALRTPAAMAWPANTGDNNISFANIGSNNPGSGSPAAARSGSASLNSGQPQYRLVQLG